jgi:hypothetical protein
LHEILGRLKSLKRKKNIGALRGSVLITVKIKNAAASISHLGDIYGTLSSHSNSHIACFPGP